MPRAVGMAQLTAHTLGRAKVVLVLALSATLLVPTGCVIYTSPADGSASRPKRKRRHRRPPPARHKAPSPRTVKAKPALAGAGQSVKHRPATRVQVDRTLPLASTGKAHKLPAGSAAGRPAGFRSGAEPAYWIWRGPRGDFRIRTTTGNKTHVFRGRIRAVGGTIGDVRPSRNEFTDRIWKDGDDWAFTFRTNGHADGFTFAASGASCVEFDLKLDGGPVPKGVFVGRAQRQPAHGHFVICLNRR